MGKIIDLSGQRRGRVLIQRIEKKEKNRIIWRCLCDCGKTFLVPYTNLRVRKDGTVNTKSCGCLTLFKMQNGLMHRTHGFSSVSSSKEKHKLLKTWQHLKGRCETPTDFRFGLYGGRGIRVEWESFEDFKEDMYDSMLEHIKCHGIKDTTLDRVDNNGNYSKKNCRWATWKQQQNNRRSTKIVTFKGKKLSIAQLAEHVGVKYEHLRMLISSKKMSAVDAVTILYAKL